MTDNTSPERIWLQTAGSYAEAYEATVGMDGGVTWCETPQDERDQEYIRADLGSFYQEKDIDAMQAEIDRLRAENERLRNPPEDYCAKCGAPRNDHPYRHLFVSVGAALREGEGEG